PGASMTCTGEYTVTQADIDAGEVSNTATGTGDDPQGGAYVGGPSNTVVTEFIADPGIKVTKSTEGTVPGQAGGVLHYVFVVENTGNVTLSSVSVAEGEFTGTGTAPTVTCPDGALAPGETVTCTAEYTVTEADIVSGAITNSATATGTTVRGDDPTSDPNDPDSTTETSLVPTPGLAVTVTADKDTVTTPGEKVVFTFTVTNTGNVSIFDPSVDVGGFSGLGDALVVVCEDEPNPLLPGDTLLCRAEYIVVEGDLTGAPLTLTAIASGLDPNGETITSPPSEALAVPASVFIGLAVTGGQIPLALFTIAVLTMFTGLGLLVVRRRRTAQHPR
ncbi:MAG: hypothetical protein QM568_05505, partial [Microbacterium sp.]